MKLKLAINTDIIKSLNVCVMTKDGPRTTPKALFLTHWVQYKLWLFLPLFIHSSIVPLILMLYFKCKCPYFSSYGIFFLFEERKIIAFHISTNAASFVFYKIKDISAIFRLAFSKIVHDCPFKNCYTACTKMKPTLLSVVRTVASRSICISKLKPKQVTFKDRKPYSYLMSFWKWKFPKPNNHFFLVLNFMY